MRYKPKIIHYDGEGDPHWQFVERDVPTVTGQVFAANVKMLTDFDGNLVGFTIYEPQSPSPIVDEVAEARARALALLQAEDERQDKIHELLETIREQIRVDVAPEHRPEGLMTNIQNAVYAMRGRMRLMNDAAITSPLQPPSAALPSPPKAGEAKNARDEIVTSILNMALIGRALSDRTDIEADLFVDELRSLVTDVFVNNRIYATPEPRADMREEDGGLDAGINYAIGQLCEILDVDPNSISWDAATETMDGDVSSVICNVLRAAYGEKWSTKPEDTARIRAALDAALLQNKINGPCECACAYDSPNDICALHSPQLAASQTEVERLREALHKMYRRALNRRIRRALSQQGETK